MKPLASIHCDGMIGSLVQMSLMVLLVAAGAALYLPLREARMLKAQLESSRMRLSELELLRPLYQELAGLDTPSKWPSLVFPARQRLTEKDIQGVPDECMRMATNCLVEVSSVSPRVLSDEDGPRYLGVELRGTGPYVQIKSFLMGLVQMPTLERIEKLEIRRETLQEQFVVVVRLALE